MGICVFPVITHTGNKTLLYALFVAVMAELSLQGFGSQARNKESNSQRNNQ